MVSSYCCATFFSVFFMLLGIMVLVGVGIIYPKYYIPTAVQEDIDSKILFTKTDMELHSARYASFIGGAYDPDVDEEYADDQGSPNIFWLTNMTNARAFILGKEKPNIKQVGPFGYASVGRKYDVEFIDEDLVSYKSYSFIRKVSPHICSNTMLLYGLPDPKECLNFNTEIIVPNYRWNILVQANDLYRHQGHFFSQMWQHTYNFIYPIAYSIVENYMPQVWALQHEYLRLWTGREYVQKLYTNASASINLLNMVSYASDCSTNKYCKASPAAHIKNAFTEAGKSTSKAFEDPNVLAYYYNKDNPISFFNISGFSTWHEAATSDNAEILNALEAPCLTAKETDCKLRIQGILNWLFEEDTGLVYSSDVENQRYNTFVNARSSICIGNKPCEWNYQKFRSANYISFSVFNQIFNETSPIGLTNPSSLSIQKSALDYCSASKNDRVEMETSSCAKNRKYFSDFVYLRDNMIQIDHPDWSKEQITNLLSGTSKEAQDMIKDYRYIVCDLVTHFHTNLMNIYEKASWARELVVKLIMNDPEKKDLYQETFGYRGNAYPDPMEVLSAQMLNNYIVQFLEVSYGHELDLMLDMVRLESVNGDTFPNLTIVDLQELNLWITADYYNLEKVFRTHAYVNDTTKHFNSVRYEPRMRPDYPENTTVSQSIQRIFNIYNQNETSTLGTTFLNYVALYLYTFFYGAQGMFCHYSYTQLHGMPCDFTEGGAFLRVTADQYLFHGKVDPGTKFMWQLIYNYGGMYHCDCLRKHYFLNDGTIWDGEEPPKGKDWLYNGCNKVGYSGCGNHGLTCKLKDDVPRGPYSVIEHIWDEATDAEKYYDSIHSFKILNATEEVEVNGAKTYRHNATLEFGDFPSAGHNIGSGYGNIQYQMKKSCPGGSNCSIIINTGAKDRALINNVVEYKGMRKSPIWENADDYGGGLGSQFKPQYIDGILAPKCPDHIELFDSGFQTIQIRQFDKMTTLEYIEDSDTAFDVCRYSVDGHVFEAQMDRVKLPKMIRPPKGFRLASTPKTLNESQIDLEHWDQLYISAPNFLFDEQINDGKEKQKFTGVATDAMKDSTFVDIEPSTGSTYRAITQYETYFKFARNPIYPFLKEDYYLFPKGYSINGGAMGPDATKGLGDFVNKYKGIPTLTRSLGIGGGIVCLMIGLCLCIQARRHGKKLAGKQMMQGKANSQ